MNTVSNPLAADPVANRSLALLDRALLLPAVRHAFAKLDPQ